MKSSWLHGVMHGTRHHNILCFLLWQQILRITLYNRICVMSEALDITTLRELTGQVGQHRCKVLIWVVLMFDILFWFTFVFLKKIFLWFLSFQVVGWTHWVLKIYFEIRQTNKNFRDKCCFWGGISQIRDILSCPVLLFKRSRTYIILKKYRHQALILCPIRKINRTMNDFSSTPRFFVNFETKIEILLCVIKDIADWLAHQL